MAKKSMMLLVLLLVFCGTAYGKTDRWHKLMEDADLSYFVDDKSILATREGTTIFWMKLASKKKDFLKTQYQMPDLDYILFNYEINCNKAVYKSRGIIYYDRSGKQIDKQVPTNVDMTDAEPIPPESVMEVAQYYICPEEDSSPQLGSIVPEMAPAPAQAPELPGEAVPGGK